MAIEVEMSDDIRKYETKSFGPFTTRQMVCLGIGLGYSVPIGMLVEFQDISNRVLLIAVLALPAILAGFIKMDGVPFEVLVLRVLYWKVLAPPKRRYVTANSFHEAMLEEDAAREKEKRQKMGQKKRKAYEKAHDKYGNATAAEPSGKKELKVYR